MCGHFFLPAENLNMYSFRQILPAIVLLLILVITFFAYRPGLHGGFLFDDYPNLQELGTYGGVKDFETFKNFVLNGVSSPLGRPLALTTFLLDDNTWPTKAIWFKETNLKIHLLTGLLLCWATLNLMRLFGRSENESVWIALLSSAIWLLHPYMVSTTLYVVQRMAQLAATFVFAGLAGYFYGRLILQRGELTRAYLWMSLSLGIATPLALLSKENGVLLPMLALVVNACLPNRLVAPVLWWRIIFLWAPSFVVIFMLAKEINFSPDAWPNRPFTQPERLLTEPRIIWEYLYNLYCPKIEGRGLFQDGFPFSRGLFQPVSTAIALAALMGVTLLAICYRQLYPLLALSILFFLVAHLLESSVVGLELYFEHRNYLSAAFLFLPIAAAVVDLKKHLSLGVVALIAILLLTIVSFFTWKRAQLWSDTVSLERYWAASTPESPRAQNKLGSLMLEAGNIDQSIAHMESAVKLFPKSSLLVTNLLLIKVYAETVTETDFRNTAELFRNQPFDAQAVFGFRNLTDMVIRHEKHKEYLGYMLILLDDIKNNPNYSKFYLFNKFIPYLKAKIYLAMGDYDQAYEQFSLAMKMYYDTETALSIVAEMANANRPVEALMLFKGAEVIFKNQPDKTLRRSRELYNHEFERIHSMLEENLNELGIKVVDTPNASSAERVNNDIKPTDTSKK